jgi:Lipopolysaccharide-assembly
MAALGWRRHRLITMATPPRSKNCELQNANCKVYIAEERLLILQFAICILQLIFTGCAGYQVGAGSLYAPDVTTVYVPMIDSDSYRRDLGERLTEAVIKEIELKTPYKVVGTPDADSILSARLLTDTRRTLAENAFDDPRVSEIELRAEVTWLNRRRLPIVPMQTLPLPPELVLIGQTTNLIPEIGQSVASSQQQAIERLAQQIVSTMEVPW